MNNNATGSADARSESRTVKPTMNASAVKEALEATTAYVGTAYANAKGLLASVEHALHDIVACERFAREIPGGKIALPSELSLAVSEYRSARDSLRRVEKGRQETVGKAEREFLAQLECQVADIKLEDENSTNLPKMLVPAVHDALAAELAAVAVALEELHDIVENVIDWDDLATAPIVSSRRKRALSHLWNAVRARREIRDVQDALKKEMEEQPHRSWSNEAIHSLEAEDARWFGKCLRCLAKLEEAQSSVSNKRNSDSLRSSTDWLPSLARKAAMTWNPRAVEELQNRVRVVCRNSGDAERLASARHDLRHRVFEFGLVTGPARGLLPSRTAADDGSLTRSQEEFLGAQCRVAHAILCGECDVGEGGVRQRVPLRLRDKY